MLQALPQFAAAFAVPVVLALFMRHARRASPAHASPGGGRIGLSRSATVFLAMGGVMFTVLAIGSVVFALIDDDPLLFVFAPFFAAFAIPSVWLSAGARSWQVAWDETGLRGPATQWSLRRHPPQAMLPWSSIVSVTADRSGCRAAASVNGTRVVWSPLYAGHQVLEDVLKTRCPTARHEFP